jgi:predicted nucleic acid-binding protein
MQIRERGATLSYLIDTCVISELVRAEPSAAVVEWIASVDEDRLYVSVLTLGELHKGVAKLTDPVRARRLRLWLEHDVVARFEGRILPVDASVASRWGKLSGEAMTGGLTLPVIDALLAATAQQHALTVVTRNVKDLERCGVEILNPWEAE